MIKTDLDCTLIDALRNPALYPHPVMKVELLETHISWLLLAGDYVYKIKKPVDFGFLDFSELGKRRFFCQEELRLNRRFASDVYLEVLAVGGSAEHPVFGKEPAIEYTVKMRRFAETDLLDKQLAQGALSAEQMQALAQTLADFHAGLPPALEPTAYGTPEAVAGPARQNFQQLAGLITEADAHRLARLEAASEREYTRCSTWFARRLADGKIRECHGDLHLGNIVLLDGKPTPFDGIDFNPDLRWIDVMNDIAFLVMDLLHRRRPDLAYAFLNAYLQAGGDYAGLAVLRFYLGYRAMVMAKVAAIRAAQGGRAEELGQCRGYLDLAEAFYAEPKAALLITHGLPGCGKTTVSQIVLEKFRAIRLRSDVERKRLFGLAPEQRSESAIAGGIYTEEATDRTYCRLLALSRSLLENGYPVVVDAAFLRADERQAFAELAAELGVPFVILHILNDESLSLRRIGQRLGDASEADAAVYQQLKTAAEPLSPAERRAAVEIDNSGDKAQLLSEQAVWGRLAELAGLA